MSGEKFCLKWNDFEKNISSSFRDLRSDRQLFDVTLACEDEHIQAHKVILSACSSFFRNILVRSSNHTNLLLYLKGISSRDMESVLNFMYHGEVSVAQDDLNGFLQVAEDLKVKGLTQGNNQSEEEPVSKPQSSFHQPKTTQRRAQPVQRPVVTSHDDDIQEVTPVVKTETGHGDPGDSMVYDEGSGGGVMAEYDESYAEYGQYGDQEYDASLMGQDPAMAGSKQDMIQCPHCALAITKKNLNRHIKHQHQNSETVVCEHCNSQYKNEASLSNHLRLKHGIYK